MPESLIAGVLALVGSGITAWLVYLAQARKRPIEAAAAAAANARTLSDGSREWVDSVRADMRELRADMDRLQERAERAERRAEAAELAAVQAINELAAERSQRARIITHAVELHDWIEAGATPPPPTRPPWAQRS